MSEAGLGVLLVRRTAVAPWADQARPPGAESSSRFPCQGRPGTARKGWGPSAAEVLSLTSSCLALGHLGSGLECTSALGFWGMDPGCEGASL